MKRGTEWNAGYAAGVGEVVARLSRLVDPVAHLYLSAGTLDSVDGLAEVISVMVDDVELLRSEADRLHLVTELCNSPSEGLACLSGSSV